MPTSGTYYMLAHRIRRRWVFWVRCESMILSKETTYEEATGMLRAFRRDHPSFDFYWCGTARPTHCGCGRPL